MSINRHFIRENKVMLLVMFLPIAFGILASFIIPRVTHHNRALAERSAAADTQKDTPSAYLHMSEGISGD